MPEGIYEKQDWIANFMMTVRADCALLHILPSSHLHTSETPLKKNYCPLLSGRYLAFGQESDFSSGCQLLEWSKLSFLQCLPLKYLILSVNQLSLRSMIDFGNQHRTVPLQCLAPLSFLKESHQVWHHTRMVIMSQLLMASWFQGRYFRGCYQ